MKVLTYHVTLLEPCLVTALQGDPNSGVAFSYLPGTVLRGMLAAKYLQTGDRVANPPDATDALFRRRFLDGSTRYLNGYLVDKQGNRLLPTPRSWQQEKTAARQDGDKAPIYDFAIHPEPEVLNQDGEPPQWKEVGKPFCYLYLHETTVHLEKDERYIAVHTARNRRMGRATRPRPQPTTPEATEQDTDDPAGAVYRYDALAAGQTFAAAILCEKEEDAEELKTLLSGEVLIGGSRNGGYGRARIDQVGEPDSWSEIENEEDYNEDDDDNDTTAYVDRNNLFIVTLLSHAFLRDANGQYTVSLPAITKAIAAKLGCPLTLVRAYTSAETLGGFNRKWGLPTPQMLATAMGSVFVFEKPDCTAEKIRDLENHGFGERRAEGFGRVAVNWHTAAEWMISPDSADVDRPDPIALPAGSLSETLAGRMAERLLRRELDDQLARQASEKGKQIRKPQASQLNRLRQVIRDALAQEPEKGRQRLQRYLQNLNKRQVTKKQFTGDRIDEKPLLEWLKAVAESKELWIESPLKSKTRIGKTTAVTTPKLIYEYNLRLIDAALGQAAKAARQKEG